MANFRKSFNFRNGVQVDEDNFIVNSAGLVGIGTSVPTEFLDVRGSLKVVGLATVQDAFIGVATVQNKLEVGITSFSSGIITAKTGIVTYYGDARYLQGMPTSQWVDIDVGLGYTSIYAAGNVGVGTVDPRFTFQVSGNNDVSNFTNGVGINSSGDMIVAGIATITKMYGWGIGVTGLNAGDAIATGTLNNDRLPSNISISGILTSGSLLTGPITATGDVATGAITASGNLSVTGIATVSSDLTVLGSITGTASTAQSITGSPDLIVGVVTATKLIANTIEVPSTGITTISKLLHVGTGGTAFSALESGRIGVGTALPTRSLQIVEDSDAAIELISESGECKIIFGQQVLPSVGAGDSSAVLRFGNADKTFDIIHNDTGNLNMYLHAGATGVDTGRFNWVYGQSNAELMSLTYGGRLGIGKSNPDETLHVVGTSTVTESVYVGQNLYVAGNIVGSIALDPIITSNVNVNSGVSTFKSIEILTDGGQISIGAGSSIGISTDAPVVDLDARYAVTGALFKKAAVGPNIEVATLQEETFTVNGSARFDGVGIGTSSSAAGYGILLAKEFEQIGSTSYFYNSSVYVYGQSGVGVGTTAARSAVDFADAGRDNPGLLPGEGVGSRAYFLPPQNSSTQRVGLATERGAIIFNTSTNKFQGYTGTTWVDFH